GAASEAIARRAGLEIFRQSSSPDGKACYQPATTD
ncbi:DNA methylase, partial [Escherichia coli FRIK1997]